MTDLEWASIEDVMASRAVFLAQLLSGEMPEEIEEAFVESATTLFPASGDDLVSACSCPDWENPCKHVAAVFYLMAEAFDDDPFLIFAWRGRDKDQLLADLRARRRGPGAGESEDEDGGRRCRCGEVRMAYVRSERRNALRSADVASFWGDPEDLSTIELRPRLGRRCRPDPPTTGPVTARRSRRHD